MAKNKKEEIFLLTDGCMWEMNKQQGKSAPHSIEVVDINTGQIRYIRSGAKIRLVAGEISKGRDQSDYNNQKSSSK